MNLALPKLARVFLAALFSAAFLLVAHIPASAHHAGATLPILRYDAEDGQATWPSTLDPSVAEDGFSIGVFDLIYAAPVKLNYTTYAIIPDLTTGYTISKDHKTYWFNFRHGLKFSNGDPVTAQDEVWSLTRLLKKSTNSPVAISYFGHIVGAKKLNDGKTNTLAGVKALGPYVLQVRIDKPIAYFIKTFSYWANKVLDPRVVGNHKPGTYLTDDCSANVGTGPFMFKCRNSSTSKSSFYAPGTTPTITLVPNPYYYGRKPKIELVVHFFATYQVGLDAYKADQLDIAVLQGGDIGAYKGSPQLRRFPAPSIDSLDLNTQAPPFNNVHCRLALAYAIDQPTLDNVVMRGTFRPLYSIVPPPIPGAYKGANNPHYNPTLAKQELAQCPGGIKGVTLVYWKSGTDADNRFSAVQNMLSQVGINIQIKGLPVNDWLTDVSEPQNQTHNTLVEFEWGMDFPDPEDFCTLLLRGGMLYNVGQFNDPTYNQLVDSADVTLNQKVRVQRYEQAQHLALSTGAWAMIGQVVQYAVVKPWVHGLVAAYGNSYVAPVHDDWANVTVSPH
jgi:ABC-type transport system substrate-binding protein